MINAIKGALAPRPRTSGAKAGGKGKGKRKKADPAAQEASPAAATATDATTGKTESWGILEPFHGLLEPVTGMLKPLLNGNAAILIIGVLLFMLFFRGSSRPTVSSHDIGCPGYTLPQRLAAYEEMWRREESELWSWLEDRVGLDGAVFPTISRPSMSPLRQKAQQLRSERELSTKMGQEKMSDREMDAAIRATRERLDALEEILNKRKTQPTVVEEVQSRHEL